MDGVEPKRARAGHGLAFGMLRLIGSPVFWLSAFVAFVLAGLALPLRLPLGPNYWDTAVYLDAVQRIRMGQVPSIDFFAPVGPLGYYLTTGLEALFPQAQPMLLVNWAVLPVALPLLALLTAHVGHRSRAQALLLLLPFLLFASLPVNLHGLYPMPGFDGYGHYNRHVSLLLYVLIAALLFVRNRRLLNGMVAALMLALFLVKITGAVTGTILVGYAMLAGRMRIRDVAVAAGLVLVVLAVLDLATGVVRAYLADILTLLGLNTGELLPRFLTVASVKFNVVGPGLLLLAVLAFAAWRERVPFSLAGLRALLAAPLGWFAAALFALTFFETQNTGSLEFIGLWPIVLLVLLGSWGRRDRLSQVVLVLALAVSLPTALIFTQRAARAALGGLSYTSLKLPDLGPLGRVSLKPDIAERAVGMLEHYAGQQESYRDLVRRNLLPSYILYSEIDYQATWLLEVQQGVTALRAWEAANKRRLESLFTLDFVDPFNYLLDRRPTPNTPIGIDPRRSTPDIDQPTLEGLNQADAILEPKCPPTTARTAITQHFAEALKGRRLVALAPCWDMYLKE
ncbi:hypothetical protein DWF00_27865 [Bosea caraganae]|uniref:Glycosyltransferase RgtA/B/C/D-like domain-containing protein n=2 Tax=Bosea caraganae TaxID=2763117 RepID=A0A370KYY6_9HYPH|nr:hypothetical protein DWE98_25690 [Bosea caraganae]RDJ21188.1 hypothetical protein DWF00_27865 [Bosea caraganae]